MGACAIDAPNGFSQRYLRRNHYVFPVLHDLTHADGWIANHGYTCFHSAHHDSSSPHYSILFHRNTRKHNGTCTYKRTRFNTDIATQGGTRPYEGVLSNVTVMIYTRASIHNDVSRETATGLNNDAGHNLHALVYHHLCCYHCRGMDQRNESVSSPDEMTMHPSPYRLTGNYTDTIC